MMFLICRRGIRPLMAKRPTLVTFNHFTPHEAQKLRPKEAIILKGSLIHTSPQRQALPPFLVVMIKPLSRILAVLIGRRFRKWWRKLDGEKQEEIKAKSRQYSHLWGGKLCNIIMTLSGDKKFSFPFYYSLGIRSFVIWNVWLRIPHPGMSHNR